MWSKTLSGVFFGFVLNVSLMMNIAFLLPVDRQVVLLIGYIGGFFVWAGIATYFYCVENLKPVLVKSAIVLFISATINGLFVSKVLS